jgi:glycosyltransferase involved in cell wall biosynthesis
MKLKIAFVVSRIDIGGMEVFIFRLGRALALRGHSVDVISAGIQGAWWSRVAEHGLGGWSFLEAKSFCPISHAVRLCRFLRSQRYDVVLLNHCIQIAPALSLLPESMIVIPVVHNDEEWVYRVACANWRAWDVAVGVSERVAKKMKSRVPQRETKTILNGVDVPGTGERFSNSGSNAVFKMLFIGRLAHKQKGVLLLPQILANVLAKGINARLTVIGDGPDQCELQQRLKQFCPAKNFSVVPTQSGDAVYRSMLSHHALLMPSFYEGLGMVALEAQACGCVPIASMLPGVTDVTIADRKTGFLCAAGDTASIVASVVQLASDKRLWERMSVAAQQRIAEEFTIEVMTSKYLELFSLAQQGYFVRETKRCEVPIDFSIYGWRGVVPNGVRRLHESFAGLGREAVQPSVGLRN